MAWWAGTYRELSYGRSRTMSPAGYSGTPLPRKLGIKEGHRVATFGAPTHFAPLLEPLPPGARVVPGPGADDEPYEVLVVFVRTHDELAERFSRAQALLDPYGGLWVAWPKRTSALATDLKEQHVREHGLSTGLVDNKICAIDADWSGLRFVVRKENRPPRRG